MQVNCIDWNQINTTAIGHWVLVIDLTAIGHWLIGHWSFIQPLTASDFG